MDSNDYNNCNPQPQKHSFFLWLCNKYFHRRKITPIVIKYSQSEQITIKVTGYHSLSEAYASAKAVSFVDRERWN